MLLAARIALLVAAIFALAASFATAHNRPVIGILAQPKWSMDKERTYIAASYVKWVEAAGARVVPIPYNVSHKAAEELLSQINGVLLPGGAAYISDGAKSVMKIALELNQKGVHFPIWATCMGFQWISMFFANDYQDSFLDTYDSWNISYPLVFTDEAHQSRFYKMAPPGLMRIYSDPNLKVTMNNHHYGVNMTSFNDYLSQHFRLISVNDDEKGKEFVATMEHRNYPIYAVQWHPEKNVFEWDMHDDGSVHENIEHSAEAVLASQYPANLFVNEARKNQQRFKDPLVEKEKLIYNYNSTISSYGFIQSYYFDNFEY